MLAEVHLRRSLHGNNATVDLAVAAECLR
jgi:hypothetical protein